MTSVDEFQMFLGMFVNYLPIFIACVVAIVVLLVQKQRVSRPAPWALLGFGLALAFCVVVPIGQVMLRAWIVNTARSFKDTSWMYGALGIASSTLVATSLVSLLVAVLAGRTRPPIPPPMPGSVPPPMPQS